jgi:single-stranded-DNA-specific exonuclease
MTNIEKIWKIAEPISEKADIELQPIDPVLRQILFNRGYRNSAEALEFINAKIPKGTEPFNLLNMQIAVDRINWAVQKNHPIAIYGDYDVDGVTATALLTHALKQMNASVWSYIPNRFEEGYGLNQDALGNLKDGGAKLVITVDCGIRSPDEVSYAQNLGLDMIVTDHHSPGPELPPAHAIINPKQHDDSYPEKDLVGVSLAYKLVDALYQSRNRNSGNTDEADKYPNPNDYLDLVALGTVADLAPLIGENRALVRAGIDQLRNTKRFGLMALIGIAGVQPKNITAGTIGYMLGPRLNAAGRLDTAQTALNLLLAEDFHEAGLLAQKLDSQNRQRQTLTKESQIKAEEIVISEDSESPLLFIYHPDFNPGIVGLVASRLTEKYYRPSVVANQENDFTRGSCRSIPNFNITKALEQCSDLLVRYGGHSSAAGFTVKNELLPEFKTRLIEIAHNELDHQELFPILEADVEVQLSDLTFELLNQLNKLQPTGRGNPQAQFVSFDVRVLRSRTVGKDKSHLKLVLSDGFITYDAIAFRQGDWQERLPEFIDIIFNFELNEYNGKSTLQLNILDIKDPRNRNL